jgi:hypothetical protein
MKFKIQMSRSLILVGVILGIIACLILSTTFFSLLERGPGPGVFVMIVLIGIGALGTTGYLVYLFRRSGE